MPLLFPDFSTPEARHMGARGKLIVIREYVLGHQGPIPKEEVQRLLVLVCGITLDLLDETQRSDKWSMDAKEVERLLRMEISLLQPVSA